MLLRRMMLHVREQNWFAVILDFVIVLAGVLLAFQITAWNAARQDVALERAYLTRLADEFVAVEDELEDAQGDLDDARAGAERFLEALDAGDRAAMQAEAFALLSITRVSEVQIQSAALHELISSGRLGLIRNDDLRADLARLSLTEADAHGVFDQLKAQQIDVIAVLRPHIRVTMQGYDVSAIELSDGLTGGAPELVNTLSSAIYVNSTASLFTAVLRNEVEELRAALAEELDRS